MATTDTARWEDQPGFLRDSIEGGIGFAQTMVRDYTQCVKDKAIADRRFDKDDPQAWEKTVDTLVSNVFILGHMVGGAGTLGLPNAEELFDKYTLIPKESR